MKVAKVDADLSHPDNHPAFAVAQRPRMR